MRLRILKNLDAASNPIAVFEDDHKIRRFIEYSEIDEPTVGDLDTLSGDEIKRLLKTTDVCKLLKTLEDKLMEDRYISENRKIVRLNNKSMMFMPDFKKERELLYIYGPSGSGKSFLTSKYCKEFKLVKPDYEIFLISVVKDDPSLDFNYIHIPLVHDIIVNIDLESLRNSLVIFDDTDTPNDKAMSRLINSLKDDIAQTGRHYNISAIITTHMACNYNKTRVLLSECQKYIIFPSSSGGKQMKNMFCTYGGISPKKFDLEIKKVPSRWCMLNTSYPNYLIYDNMVELL
jgi:hypothetical protein